MKEFEELDEWLVAYMLIMVDAHCSSTELPFETLTEISSYKCLLINEVITVFPTKCTAKDSNY